MEVTLKTIKPSVSIKDLPCLVADRETEKKLFLFTTSGLGEFYLTQLDELDEPNSPKETKQVSYMEVEINFRLISSCLKITLSN